MSKWGIDYAGNAKTKLKQFGKKSPDEFRAIMANLNRYLEALSDGTSPRSITAGFIHPGESKMKGKKRFGSVTELVADVTDDEDIFDAVKRTIEETSLGTMLFRLRCRRGFTQAQVATEMNTTQSAVSKIEHSPDDKISVRQIVRYTQAIGMTMTLTFDRPRNAVEHVKALFAEICEKMEELRAIAGDDETIRKGVESFHDEWLLNTVLRVLEGKNELRSLPAMKPQRTLTVVASEDPSDEVVRQLIRRYVKGNADARFAPKKK